MYKQDQPIRNGLGMNLCPFKFDTTVYLYLVILGTYGIFQYISSVMSPEQLSRSLRSTAVVLKASCKLVPPHHGCPGVPMLVPHWVILWIQFLHSFLQEFSVVSGSVCAHLFSEQPVVFGSQLHIQVI